jgi:hypothetical protein
MESLLDRMAALERAQEEAARQARRWRSAATALLVAGLAGVGLLAGRPSHAVDSIPVRVTKLETRVTALETKVTNLQTALAKETSDRQAADTTLQGNLVGAVDTLLIADDEIQGQVDLLKDKLSHVSIQTIDGYYSLVLTGANLHIRNGLGATNGNPGNPLDPQHGITNGLGNLIVGYNDSRVFNGVVDKRTGSHNLIVGAAGNYSSFGGLLAGDFNEISGPYATVSAGQGNIASGVFASVSGGSSNNASGDFASISGGALNIASGFTASVTGGDNNTASGRQAAISGGEGNTAGGSSASVSGGSDNTASGSYASVSGGQQNAADGSYASVSGGQLNFALGNWSSVSGGHVNFAGAFPPGTGGPWSSISGGNTNFAGGSAASISGGLGEAWT